MKVLFIGNVEVYEEHEKGNAPSHWLYGAVEIQKNKHDVVWTQEDSSLLNDLKLIRENKPDIIFIPNLNLHNHLLLLFLKSLHIIKIPIYAYLHHEPSEKKGFKSRLYKQLLKSVNHTFFLSELTRKNCIDYGFITEDKSSVPGWGADEDFYKDIQTSDNGWFVSTGKENRDFDILIEAFKQTGAPLHIITPLAHGDQDYSDLENKCKDIPNIKLTFVPNSPENYRMMVEEMAAARALVCPLKQGKLNYCVGLSTITDAEALHKPLIITDNPYHRGRNEQFERVRGIDDWIKAIHKLQASVYNTTTTSSMSCCIKNMNIFIGS